MVQCSEYLWYHFEKNIEVKLSVILTYFPISFSLLNQYVRTQRWSDVCHDFHIFLLSWDILRCYSTVVTGAETLELHRWVWIHCCHCLAAWPFHTCFLTSNTEKVIMSVPLGCWEHGAGTYFMLFISCLWTSCWPLCPVQSQPILNHENGLLNVQEFCKPIKWSHY